MTLLMCGRDIFRFYHQQASQASHPSQTALPKVQNPSNGNEVQRTEGLVVTDVTDVTQLELVKRVCAHCQKNRGQFCVASVGGEGIWLHLGCMDEYRP
jgi:hypothetical protein